MLPNQAAGIVGRLGPPSSREVLVDLSRSLARPQRVSGEYLALRRIASMCEIEFLSAMAVSAGFASIRRSPTCCSRARACWRTCAHPPPVVAMALSTYTVEGWRSCLLLWTYFVARSSVRKEILLSGTVRLRQGRWKTLCSRNSCRAQGTAIAASWSVLVFWHHSRGRTFPGLGAPSLMH